MGAIIDSMKSGSDYFYPKTKTSAVYDDSNNRLDNTLTSINDSLNAIEVSKANVLSEPNAFGSIVSALSTLTSKMEAKTPYLVNFQVSGVYSGYMFTYQKSSTPNYAMGLVTQYNGNTYTCVCVSGVWTTTKIN